MCMECATRISLAIRPENAKTASQFLRHEGNNPKFPSLLLSKFEGLEYAISRTQIWVPLSSIDLEAEL
jgi:hypothetical protein